MSPGGGASERERGGGGRRRRTRATRTSEAVAAQARGRRQVSAAAAAACPCPARFPPAGALVLLRAAREGGRAGSAPGLSPASGSGERGPGARGLEGPVPGVGPGGCGCCSLNCQCWLSAAGRVLSSAGTRVGPGVGRTCRGLELEATSESRAAASGSGGAGLFLQRGARGGKTSLDV